MARFFIDRPIFAGVIAALYARLRHWATAPLA